jgi:hypothetical protein
MRGICAGNPSPRRAGPGGVEQTWLGEVEAADEREAIEKAAKEFKVIASKLIAVQRRQRASGEGTLAGCRQMSRLRWGRTNRRRRARLSDPLMHTPIISDKQPH